MKEIIIQVSGNDHTPHGQGGWELDYDYLDVTDTQYSKIKKAFEEGETDLVEMNIYGLKGKCRSMIREQLDYARERAEIGGAKGEALRDYMSDVDIYINVIELDESEGQEE